MSKENAEQGYNSIKGKTIACVASVSSRVRRESWDDCKKKGMTGEGEGNEGIIHFCQLLKLDNLLRRSFFTFIYSRSSKMNYFIYTSHHFTPHGRYELNKLTSLPMCSFIAQLVEQRTGNTEVTGSDPVEALIFFSGFVFPVA